MIITEIRDHLSYAVLIYMAWLHLYLKFTRAVKSSSIFNDKYSLTGSIIGYLPPCKGRTNAFRCREYTKLDACSPSSNGILRPLPVMIIGFEPCNYFQTTRNRRHVDHQWEHRYRVFLGCSNSDVLTSIIIVVIHSACRCITPCYNNDWPYSYIQYSL